MSKLGKAGYRIFLVVGCSLIAILFSCGLNGSTIAEASSPLSLAVHPSITRFHLTGARLPATGGIKRVFVMTKNAKICRLILVSRPKIKVRFNRRSRSCVRGPFREQIAFAANKRRTRLPIRFRFVAKTKTGIATRSFIITLSKPSLVATTTTTSLPPGTPTTTTMTTPSSTPTTTLPVATVTSSDTNPTLSMNETALSADGGTVTLTYTSQNASTCTLLSSPALWAGNNPASVNCNGTYVANIPPTWAGQQWTFTFGATAVSGQITSVSQTLDEQSPSPTESPNWSGYVLASSSIVTYASGQWVVPALDCSATPNGSAVTWVGIGGVAWPTGGMSGALLQTGIGEQCVNGVAQNPTGWWEDYPSDPNQSINFSDFPVSPGDAIIAQVYQSTAGCGTSGTGCTQWVTKLENQNTKLCAYMITGEGWGVSSCTSTTFTDQGTTTNLPYTGGYTAEWIEEDPGNATTGSPLPFADYGSVTFSNLATDAPSWPLTPTDAYEIYTNGIALSTPSVVSNNGFSLSYTG